MNSSKVVCLLHGSGDSAPVGFSSPVVVGVAIRAGRVGAHLPSGQSDNLVQATVSVDAWHVF